MPPPSATPTTPITIMVARIRFGANSLTKAMEVAMTPPRPMPAMKRRISIWFRVKVRTAARVKRPNQTEPASRTGLRPPARR